MNINKLNPEAKKLLFDVHRRHLAAMGTEEKERHSLNNIINVVVCKDHIKVYYKHGDWYHYHVNGTWY